MFVYRQYKRSIFFVFTILFWTLLTTSCNEDIAGIEGTGISDDTILSKGSITTSSSSNSREIVVNGITYDTSSALVVVDDTVTDNNFLDSGQVIEVIGRLASNEEARGTAEFIRYRTDVRGPISKKLIEQKQFIILGQTIDTNEAIFSGNIQSYELLKEGDFIEVSGFRKSNGDIVATKIDSVENKAYLVTGVVKDLNPQTLSFKINRLSVDYSKILQVGHISNGELVSVVGEKFNSEGSLIAISINSAELDISKINTDDRVELEGFVTNFTSFTEFKVDGIEVITKEDTIFVGDLEEDDIAIDIKLEIEGHFNDDGKLVADRIIILVAHITSHKHWQQLTSNTLDLEWTDVEADNYRLIVKNAKKILYDQYLDGSITKATIPNLPNNGAAIGVELHTEQNGRWTKRWYQFFTPGESLVELTSHSHGDSLSSNTETFTWSGEAEQYHLKLHRRGGRLFHDNYYDGNVKSTTIGDLPVNQAELSLQLWALQDGWWSPKYYLLYSYNELKNAKIISPKNNKTIHSDTLKIEWELVENADKYQLVITNGNEGQKRTRKKNFDNQTSSAEIHGLPNNHARLDVQLLTIRNKTPGGAQKRYRFYSPGHSNCLGKYQPEGCLTPLYNEGNILKWHSKIKSKTFSWDDVNAQAYHIRIKSTGRTMYNEAFDGDVTEVTIDDLPEHSGILTLDFYIKINGWWGGGSSRFIIPGSEEKPVAVLHQPIAENNELDSDTITLAWDDVGADRYWVSIASKELSPKHHKYGWQKSDIAKCLYPKGTTRATISGLPTNGKPIYLMLKTGYQSVNTKNWWGTSLNDGALIDGKVPWSPLKYHKIQTSSLSAPEKKINCNP